MIYKRVYYIIAARSPVLINGTHVFLSVSMLLTDWLFSGK
jgi:hypothetical protein